MDTEMIRNYLEGYWQFSKLYLGGVCVLVIAMLLFGRHRMRAYGLFLIGIYVTVGFYFLSICEEPEIGIEWSTGVGIFLAGGVLVGAIFYYFVFIKGAYK